MPKLSSSKVVRLGVLMLALDVLSKALGYLFNMLLVKSIPMEEYGKFTFAVGIVLAATSILTLGMGSTLSRFIAFKRGRNEDVGETIGISSSFILLCTLFWSAVLVALQITYPHLFSLDTTSFMMVLVLFISYSAYSISGGILQGFERPHITNILNISTQILKFLLVLAIISFTTEMYFIMAALVAAYVLPSLLSLLIVREHLPKRFSLAGIRELLSYSLPTTVTRTSWVLIGQADIFLLRLLMGFEAVATYYVAALVAGVLTMLISPFMQIFEPVTARLFGERSTGEVKRQNKHMLLGFGAAYVILVLPLWAFAEPIISIFFKPEYATSPAVWSLRILAVSTVLYSLSRISMRTIEAAGKPMMVAKITAVASAANIILDYFIMIPMFGLVGAALTDLMVAAAILASAHYCEKGILTSSEAGR